ncbi:sulfite exporter TauE/SafE family protein [Planctomycetota bacterium]
MLIPAEVDYNPFIPPLAAFAISVFTSTGGVSGAFLLLPFQVSVMGISSPASSPTNMLYNIVAIPSGVYRYIREGRMSWPLVTITTVGTLPGVFIGVMLRVKYFSNPVVFKFFVGWVLLYIGGQLLASTMLGKRKGSGKLAVLEEKFKQRLKDLREITSGKIQAGLPPDAVIRTLRFSWAKYEFEFWGECFAFNPLILMSVSLIIGIIGGTYGIGGGAIIAPFCVIFFALPVYAVAGAALMGTFITSIAGVAFFQILAPFYQSAGIDIAPDWKLGILFGIGGFAGIYCGARLQKFIPEKIIRTILALIMVILALKYILGFFMR